MQLTHFLVSLITSCPMKHCHYRIFCSPTQSKNIDINSNKSWSFRRGCMKLVLKYKRTLSIRLSSRLLVIYLWLSLFKVPKTRNSGAGWLWMSKPKCQWSCGSGCQVCLTVNPAVDSDILKVKEKIITNVFL